MVIESFRPAPATDLEEAVSEARARWQGEASSDIASRQLADVSKFKALAAEIAEDGFQHFVLLATGRVSACAEVFGKTFGHQPQAPELLVLDSTNPAQVDAVRAKIDPARTLFCVASQSGVDREPNLLLDYFLEETSQAGHHFIAITEAGSPLDEKARQLGFRQVFHSTSESALSDFGLVPHAAMGLDTERLLKQAVSAAEPGVTWGLTLATAALKLGRDKVTLFCSKSIRSLGAWMEQVAIPGLVVIHEEPVLPLEHYGKDRLFVFLRLAGDKEAAFEGHTDEAAIRIAIHDGYELGRIFLQWETAMSVAAALLAVPPAEQPQTYAGAEKPILEQNGIQLFADGRLNGGSRALGGAIRSHLDRLKPGDYFGLLAYVPAFPEYEAKLQRIRKEVLLAKQAATVLAFGPRFESDAGRAYQEGPNRGVFLQITYGGDDAAARRYFQSLAAHQRRVLRIHFSKDLAGGLDHLHDLICAAVAH